MHNGEINIEREKSKIISKERLCEKRNNQKIIFFMNFPKLIALIELLLISYNFSIVEGHNLNPI
jgi:hypothetical protein